MKSLLPLGLTSPDRELEFPNDFFHGWKLEVVYEFENRVVLPNLCFDFYRNAGNPHSLCRNTRGGIPAGIRRTIGRRIAPSK